VYTFTTIKNLHADLNSGTISCIQLVEESIKAIEAKKQLNAFLEVFTDSALSQAKLVDEKIKSKTAGKLAGVVIGLKDNICYKGHKVSCSSKILDGFESLYSSTVVERLLAEDAIIIGRLNCDEFAMGSSNENSAFGKVLNPLNEKTVPGGSSGGSAAAVAANLCHVTLGSDTGGSIRQPASFTGTVGLKPTYGRISRWGLIAYASSFDQIGPITKTVEDAALLLEIMAGKDEYDTTASQKAVGQYVNALSENKKYKVAYLKECVESNGLDPEVKKQTFKKTRSEGFGKEVKRRIMLGTFVLSAGYYDAYYSKAQKVRNKIRQKTREILSQHDFIVTPSTPSTAFEFGKNSTDPIKMYLEDIFTVQANIVGCPAISVPNGIHSNGLPIGLQIMGRDFEEGNLLNLAKQI
jgi:aspartyl-tRNA(Asn)/glutamyl-tRNA(Gln) amidotransferase subunit A